MSWKDYVIPAVLLILLPALSLTAKVEVGDNICSYLFSATGVLFSVAMSLIIAFNTRDMTDLITKARLRKNMRSIRDIMIVYFMISLIGLLLLKHIPSKIEIGEGDYSISLLYNFRLGYVAFMTWFLIVILINYRRIHKNYEDIEDASLGDDTER